MKAKAKFDFNAQAGNQINLKRGQVYSLLHNGGPGGWSKGVDPATGTIINMFALFIFMLLVKVCMCSYQN